MRGALGRRAPAAALLLAMAAGACAPAVKTRDFAVRTDAEANRQSPVPVDLVLVYDRTLAGELAGATARDWFLRREQIGRDYPDGVRWLSWELVPGQSVPRHRLPLRRRGARAAFVFADYLEPGEHRLRLDPIPNATVWLGTDGMSLQTPLP